MRKKGLIKGVQDSLVKAIILGVTVYVAIQFQQESWFPFLILPIIAFGGSMMINTMVAMGGVVVSGTSYEASHQKNKLTLGIMFDDKKSSGTLHFLKAVFYAGIGMMAYPFALFFAVQSLLGGNNADQGSYEFHREAELAAVAIEEDNDPTVMTSNKRWMIDNGMSSKYYFVTQKEAYDFALENKLENMPKKI